MRRLGVAIVGLAVAVAAGAFFCLARPQLAQNEGPVRLDERSARNPLSVTGKALRAKAEGKTTLVLEIGGIDDYQHAASLKEELKDLRVVVARLDDRYSYFVRDREIGTWNRFHVLSLLSASKIDPEARTLLRTTDEDLPRRFLPIDPGDLLIPSGGGTVMIEGVKVVAKDSHAPVFEKGESYLMSVGVSVDGIAGVDDLPGVYRLAGSDKLVPIGGPGDVRQKEIETMSGGSLSRLRSAFRSGGYVQ
jgi:hypothetical protein